MAISFEEKRKAARDLLIALVLVAFFAYPPLLRRIVDGAGIDHVGVGEASVYFKEAHQSTLEAASQVSSINAAIDQIKQQLASLPDNVRSVPAVSQVIAATDRVSVAAQTTTAQISTAITNQDTVLKAQGVAPPDAGWIYLGKVDRSGETWDRDVRIHIQPVTAPAQMAGRVVALVDSVFLRKDRGPPPADALTGWRAGQKVVSALAPGTSVRVVRTEVLPATDFGFALWALVTVVKE